VDRALAGIGAPNPAALEPAWRQLVSDVVRRATLTLPADGFMQSGGRQGRHTEHLGHLLDEMQILARSHPGAKW
jgi:ring-1,2-phenylacetyl-CoA epoxidase subunit PaaC